MFSQVFVILSPNEGGWATLMVNHTPPPLGPRSEHLPPPLRDYTQVGSMHPTGMPTCSGLVMFDS